MNFAYIFEQHFTEDCKPCSCVRLERSSGETNDRAPCTLKKETSVFLDKKRKKEKEKKEGKAVRTN